MILFEEREIHSVKASVYRQKNMKASIWGEKTTNVTKREDRNVKNWPILNKQVIVVNKTVLRNLQVSLSQRCETVWIWANTTTSTYGCIRTAKTINCSNSCTFQDRSSCAPCCRSVLVQCCLLWRNDGIIYFLYMLQLQEESQVDDHGEGVMEIGSVDLGWARQTQINSIACLIVDDLCHQFHSID